MKYTVDHKDAAPMELLHKTVAWDADCMRERGRHLRGRFAHYCPEWDGLPVDESTPEFKCCTCYTNMYGGTNKRRVCQVCETVRGMSKGPLCKWCLRSWQRAFRRRYPLAAEVRLMRWSAQVAIYGRASRSAPESLEEVEYDEAQAAQAGGGRS